MVIKNKLLTILQGAAHDPLTGHTHAHRSGCRDRHGVVGEGLEGHDPRHEALGHHHEAPDAAVAGARHPEGDLGAGEGGGAVGGGARGHEGRAPGAGV